MKVLSLPIVTGSFLFFLELSLAVNFLHMVKRQQVPTVSPAYPFCQRISHNWNIFPIETCSTMKINKFKLEDSGFLWNYEYDFSIYVLYGFTFYTFIITQI